MPDKARRDQEFFRRIAEVGVFTVDEVQGMKAIGYDLTRKLLGMGVADAPPAEPSLPEPPVVAEVDPDDVAKLVGMALAQPVDALTMRSPGGKLFTLYIDDNGRAKVTPVASTS